MKKKSLLPLSYLFFYLLISVIVSFIFPIYTLPFYLQVLGTIFIIAGITINVSADALFKKEKTAVKPNQKPSKLINTGPYRFSRHPMYLGSVIILLGISLSLGSLSSFIGPVLMVITLEKKFIVYEEKQMEKNFGEKYLEYKAKVRKWI